MTELVKEPRRRRDGTCARPGCSKPLRVPAVAQKGVDPRVYEQEPFCSGTCCRLYYGLPTTQENVGRPPS